MEPIVLFGVLILVFGLWLEFEPVIQRIGTLICSNTIVTRLAASLAEQRPSYGANTWVERKAG